MMPPVDSPPELCPTCGRAMGQGCLHCAMTAAVDAATLAPDGADDLPLMVEPGFAAIADPVLPRDVGRFRLLARLGTGGMGTVYEAEDTVLQRTVALKMIRAFHFATAEEKTRFQREAAAVAQLDHAHIVPIYEVGDVQGHAFLAMKLVRGGTLADALKDGAKEPRAAATIMAKVAHAVQHAHDKAVLHRDLKPSNILMDEQGKPWLTDFGMARFGLDAGVLTTTSAQIGTPQYMSPEQAAGRARDVSSASDVWALGAMLYQMLSGKAPYAGETTLAIMHAVITDEPPKWAATSPRERDLAVLVDRCLQKDASQRLSSAGLLADELERWLRDESILSRPAQQPAAWLWGAAALITMATTALWLQPSDPPAAAPELNYTIRTQGDVLIVTDVAGRSDALFILEPEPGMIAFSASDAKFSINNAAPTHSHSKPIPLASITRIEVDAGAGDDRIEVTGFTHDAMPSIRLKGGAGSDTIALMGRIAFAPGASFDLHDDAPDPGDDSLLVSPAGQLLTSGTGSITVKVSESIKIEGTLETADGGITLEANQQTVPTDATFRGVDLKNGTLRSQGKGQVTLAGRGGSAGQFQFGVILRGNTVIQGGTEGVLRITGVGGSSESNDSSGVNIEDPDCQVITRGADIEITGTGMGAPGSSSNNGIAIVGGKISAGGLGRVTLTGEGGECTPGYLMVTRGVLLRGSKTLVTSEGGDVSVTGLAGAERGAGENFGFGLESDAKLNAGGHGKVSVSGTGNMNSTGVGDGVRVGSGAVISSSGGDISVIGKASNAGSKDVLTRRDGRITTAEHGGKITLRGEKLDLEKGTVDDTAVIQGPSQQPQHQ